MMLVFLHSAQLEGVMQEDFDTEGIPTEGINAPQAPAGAGIDNRFSLATK